MASFFSSSFPYLCTFIYLWMCFTFFFYPLHRHPSAHITLSIMFVCLFVCLSRDLEVYFYQYVFASVTQYTGSDLILMEFAVEVELEVGRSMSFWLVVVVVSVFPRTTWIYIFTVPAWLRTHAHAHAHVHVHAHAQAHAHAHAHVHAHAHTHTYTHARTLVKKHLRGSVTLLCVFLVFAWSVSCV